MLSRIDYIFLVLSLLTFAVCQRQKLCEVTTRSEMTYELTDEQKQQLERQGYNLSQNPYNGIYKFVVNPKNGHTYVNAIRAFTTTGMTPYTLGVQKSYEYNAPIYPFPSFEENQPPNGIISAVSTTLDNCDRMWILDMGSFSLNDPVQLYDVALLAYSLTENRIIYRYPFPRKLTSADGPSSVTAVIIDDSRGCDKIKAIVSDTIQGRIYVFDYETERSWVVPHWSFEYDPKYANFPYGNTTLFLPAGVYSINLTPPIGKRGVKYLMYSSYAGITIYTVPVSILYREELWTKGVSLWKPYSKSSLLNKNEKGNKFRNKIKNFLQKEEEDEFTYIDVNRYFKAIGSWESLKGAYCNMDVEKGILYCALPKERGISAWSIYKPFHTMKVVARNNELLKYPAVIATKINLKGETEIVISTSNIVQIFLGMMFPHRSNYALYVCKESEFFKGDNVQCTSDIFRNCTTVG